MRALRRKNSENMKATLYLPSQPPQDVSTEGLSLPDLATGHAQVPEQVCALLGCAQELVDVLACGATYVVYSVFDYEGDKNLVAVDVVAALSEAAFNHDDEDAVLCGPILVITRFSDY